MRARAQAIAKYTIVGATCAATGLPCLAGMRFDLVLLDECSQLTEPASMLPLARVGCERLLAVGDPMQLPPTLHNHTAQGVSARGGGDAGADHRSGFDLTLTLFQRLARCSVPARAYTAVSLSSASIRSSSLRSPSDLPRSRQRWRG